MAALAEQLTSPTSSTSGSELEFFSTPGRVLTTVSAHPSWRRPGAHARDIEIVLQGSEPSWLRAVVQRFTEVLGLQPNWNSYGAERIDPQLALNALDFVAQTLKPTSPAPAVVPLASGGVQLEWNTAEIELEVTFEPGAPPYFCVSDRLTGEEDDGELQSDRPRLAAIIGRVA